MCVLSELAEIFFKLYGDLGSGNHLKKKKNNNKKSITLHS